MLDIRNGDLFVVGDKEYPIRACAEWRWKYGNAMQRMLEVTANTKRPTRTGTTTHLIGVRSTPLDPLDPELRQRLGLNTPHTLLQTYVDGGDAYYELVLEDLQR